MHIIIIKTIFCVNDSPKKNIKLSFFKLVVYSHWKRFSIKLSPTHANNVNPTYAYCYSTVKQTSKKKILTFTDIQSMLKL